MRNIFFTFLIYRDTLFFITSKYLHWNLRRCTYMSDESLAWRIGRDKTGSFHYISLSLFFSNEHMRHCVYFQET